MFSSVQNYVPFLPYELFLIGNQTADIKQMLIQSPFYFCLSYDTFEIAFEEY